MLSNFSLPQRVFPVRNGSFKGVLTGANIQNIRSAGHSVLAGNLLRWHETCWKARFKTIACLLFFTQKLILAGKCSFRDEPRS